MRNFIVTSVNSGTGVSSFAFSLAIAIKKFKRNVCLLSKSNIIKAVKKIDKFFEIGDNIDNYIINYENIGVIVQEEIKFNKDMAKVLINKLEETKKFDVFIIDASKEELEVFKEFSNEIIFITLPYLEALYFLKDFLSKEEKKCYIVINFVPKGMELDLESMEKFLNKEILGYINYDSAIQESSFYKMPVTVYKEFSKSSKQIFEIAAKLLFTKYKESFSNKLLRIIDSIIPKRKIKLTIEEISI